MADPRRTQKQIAERYARNLRYYNKRHPWRRARVAVSFLAIGGGLAGIIAFQRAGDTRFFNSGPISSSHAEFANDCVKCHDKPEAIAGKLTALKITHLISDRFSHGIAFAAIDQECQSCHKQHSLHAPTVIEDRSCSVCHQEHRGAGPMKAVAEKNCGACHDNDSVMQASAQRGAQLPAGAFHVGEGTRDTPGKRQVLLNPTRPARGYTEVFRSFASGHPAFRVQREKASDPDHLRFNHQRHFETDIPPVNGRKLECISCHQLEPDGRYMQRFSYAANCRSCHSLQFDVKNPELTLPHGDPLAVRGFLRALPTQYEALALKKGLTNPDQSRRFVVAQMTQLRERVRSGDDFEKQIFFTTDPYKPPGAKPSPEGSSFHGCAYCHEVKGLATGVPAVTQPILVDRWMPHAHFNHAKHANVKCDDCHHASASRETSDVLLPTKESCVTCHSPHGKVRSDCILCHTYHARPVGVAIAAPKSIPSPP